MEANVPTIIIPRNWYTKSFLWLTIMMVSHSPPVPHKAHFVLKKVLNALCWEYQALCSDGRCIDRRTLETPSNIYGYSHKTCVRWSQAKNPTEKMVQLLRKVAALAEDLNVAPSTHTGRLTTAYNSSSRESDTFFWLPQVPECICICTYTDINT